MVPALFIAAVLFICATLPAAAAPALWLVRSSSGKVYLFGTVHLLRKGTQWLSPEIEAAMKESQDLYLEIADPANAAALATLVKIGFDRDHPLSTKIPKADVVLLGDAAKRYGFGSEATFEPMQPWMAFMFLSVLPAIHSGYTAGNGVDLQIRKEFVAAGKPVYGFETVTQQANIFAGLPEASQVALFDDRLKSMGRQTDAPKLDAIVSAWMAGNQDALAALVQIDKSAHDALYKRLLTDRNERWANALAERLKKPGTSFVSVGAAHLVGPGGVPALLERMGFSVTRVQTSEPSATASPTVSPGAIPQTGAPAAPATVPAPTASAKPVAATLTPPPGWKARAVSVASHGFVADRVWADPARGGAILLGHLELPGISSIDLDTLDTLVHQGMIAAAGSKGSVQPSTRVRICNGTQDGSYSKVQLQIVKEDIVLAASDRGYVAEYVRRKSAPDNPAAIKSLLTLCAPQNLNGGAQTAPAATHTPSGDRSRPSNRPTR